MIYDNYRLKTIIILLLKYVEIYSHKNVIVLLFDIDDILAVCKYLIILCKIFFSDLFLALLFLIINRTNLVLLKFI